MSALSELKAATSAGDLARLVQFKPIALSYIAWKLPDVSKYKVFEIPKRSGGTRTIKAPIKGLKVLQKNLSTLLQDCVEEIEQTRGKDRVTHGFKRDRSIVTNATEHRARRHVFNLDLQDFFPSINFGRVRAYFMRNKDFLLHDKVATAIAQIACSENSLPQGSPCSPVISNLIAHILDMRLVTLASSTGCTYTRYADDLTFSTNKKIFPDRIAKPSPTALHNWVPGDDLLRIVERSGFRINPLKTNMQYRVSRQQVTGLVVNRRINVRCEYRHDVRAMVDRLLKTDAFEIKTADPTLKKVGTLNQLHGMLGFIDRIDVHNKRNAALTKDVRLSSKEIMYLRFLLYRNFFANEMPVVLCEGETDNVYLTHAIRSLAKTFPELATIKPDGKIQLNVRLYKYRKSSTARILGLRDGGSASLAKFIGTFRKQTTKFKTPSKKPVVVLYDNDSGASDVRTAILHACGKKPDGSEAFAHVLGNLYAVPTPLMGGIQSKIEDCFDAAIRATIVGGKTLDDQNDFDTATHYGKKVFAYAVVRPNADTIDFKGFIPLLTNLVAAIKDYK